MEYIRIPVIGLLILFTMSCGEENKPRITSGPRSEPDAAQIKQELERKGYKIFDYIDEVSGDTVIMQQYFMVFLKRGPNKSRSKEEADSLQRLHLEHLSRMYELGFADISGPFGDDGEIRGITIYNTPTQEMADSLAHLDPLVQLGILNIEIHPWWAAKGFPLR
jgi:uncharacterized protein YciI